MSRKPEPGTLGLRHLQRLISGRGAGGRPLAPVRAATARLLEGIFGVSIDDIDQTVAAIVAANPRLTAARSQRTRAEAKLKDTDKRVRRHQAAIEAGVNPTALVEPINAAEAERSAAKAELDNLPEPTAMTAAEIYARIDIIGELGTGLSSAQPERLDKLYDAIGLELRSALDEQLVHVSTTLRVANECVRGASCMLATHAMSRM